MSVKNILTAIVLTALVLGVGACTSVGSDAKTGPQPDTSATPIVSPLPDRQRLAPEQVVETFYRWYIDYPGNALYDGELAASGYLTDRCMAEIEATVASFDRGGVDPILWAQDRPSDITVRDVQTDSDRSVIFIETTYQDHTLSIELQRTDGTWRIDRITRPTLDSSAASTTPLATMAPATGAQPLTSDVVEGWSLYRNDDLGIAVSYPPDWTMVELKAGPGALPIGPANVRLVVHFMPEDWAKRSGPPDPSQRDTTPYIMEVTVGSLEEFRWVKPEPTQSETLVTGSLTATVETEELNDTLSLVRYVFQSPDDPDLRITFTDPISGFPERAAANGWTRDLFVAMLETLAFIG